MTVATKPALTTVKPKHRPLRSPQGGLRVLGFRTVLIVVFIAVWGLVSLFGLVDTRFLPSPGAVVEAIVAMPSDPQVVEALQVSARTILFAFVIAAGIGLAVGAVIGTSEILRESYMSALLVLMSTPKVIFLPIFLLFFGIGANSVLAFATFEAAVYITVSVAGGMQMVDARHLRMGKAFGASSLQRFITITLPSALPGIFTGLWFGVKHAFTGVLMAELFMSSEGIGGMIRRYTEQSEVAKSFALVMVTAILMIAVGSGANALENRLSRWRTNPR